MQTLKVVRTGRPVRPLPSCSHPLQIYSLFARQMARLDREHLVVLHLDGKLRLLGQETVSVGAINEAIVHPREVFKGAFLYGSASVILLHNHPSGDPLPSQGDHQATRRLRQAGALLGIEVLDHIILGDGSYFSFANSVAGPEADRRTRTADPAASYPGGWGEVGHG